VKHIGRPIVFYAASFVAALLAAATGATAQTTEPAAKEKTPAAFPVGTEYYRLQGAYQNERHGENQYIATGTFAWGHYFLDNAGFEIQLNGYDAHDEEDGYGIGINVLAKYHFVNVGRFSLYGDVLGGAFWVSQDFPTGGTELNFTYGGGPGLSYKIRDGLYIDGGIRFQHVSNFFIEGRDRNPIFNSFGGYIGVMWTH
jgi:opacity protein-like surface antigen